MAQAFAVGSQVGELALGLLDTKRCDPELVEHLLRIGLASGRRRLARAWDG
jgi:hypothetical protein